MAEATTAPFIKNEPDDQGSNPHQFMMSQYGMPSPSFGNDGIDPSELMQNNFMSYPFGSQQNLSSSFNLGNSSIDTAELLDLEIGGPSGPPRDTNFNNFVPDQRQPTGISMSHQGQMANVYSNTPEGAPIQSPFIRGNFNYDQIRSMNQQGQQGSSPHMNNMNTQFDQNFSNNNKGRQTLQGLERNSSDARSPMTPKTPALGALNIGTPESSSFPSQPIRASNLQSRHQKTLSNQWDGTPGSAQSLVESPISSPGHPSHHAGISEILKSGKHASLPAKVDSVPGHHHSSSSQTLESQEAKRRRRRASHNMVERRRRDNINERIQDLSHLVPQHRLEDDKVRKQIVNNSALSGGGMSPTNAATSLLAGGNGRRATGGNITMGLPLEEKEKGPNKGDILNGAVGWTRDLMWALYVKIQQEAELAEMINSLGGKWPFEQTEEEKRMRTELLDAMEKNDPNSFSYSRAPGSGLRVPKHTNIAGDPTQDGISPQSLSPAFPGGGSGTNSGSAQYWNSAGHPAMSFKEEDEYSMEMN